MAWSETMFIIQHFYNVFDIDKRITDMEYKAPLVAKSINGLPELPSGTTVADLTPGTLWFIKNEKTPSTIESVSILKEDHTFADPIPFSIDLHNVPLENDLQELANDMGLTTVQNYYDIIKSMLGILNIVPVANGGTGLSWFPNNQVLAGDVDGSIKMISIDDEPASGHRNNLISSEAVYNAIQKIKVDETGTTLIIE